MKSFTVNLLLLCFTFFIHNVNCYRQDFTLDEKIQHLTDMSNRKSVIRFNANTFRDYIKSGYRNYSVILMFTAMAPHRQCVVCQYVYEEYVAVANSYRYSQHHTNKLFFGMVDFDEASDMFQMMHLNAVPTFAHFSPEGKLSNQDVMDIQKIGFSAEAIAKWITERTGIKILIFRPPNYFGTGALIMLFAVVSGLLYVGRENLNFIYNKNVWAIAAVFFSIAMVSGQMWNHIRGPPFVRRNSNGEIAYIHGSTQSQFVMETYIIFNLYAAVALGMVMLIESGKKISPGKKTVFIIVGLILILVPFSLIISIFRLKTSVYPYSLLF